MRLETKNTSFSYGNNLILDDLSLDIQSGEIVSLIGANGCGKSTLLKNMSKALKPDSGGIYVDSRQLNSYSRKELARKMSVLPQSNSSPDDVTVFDLVCYGRFPYQRFLQGMNKRDYNIVESALQHTGLVKYRNRSVSSLSGGERQRAWIALSLAQEPSIMLLDEPTTYLDVCHQFEVIDLIHSMNRRLSITIVMVLHDINLASRCSDRIIAMKDNNIITAFFYDGPIKRFVDESFIKCIKFIINDINDSANQNSLLWLYDAFL